MPKRYLVTGGAGFIGSHLAEALIARGDQVIVVDNFASGKPANLAGIGDRLTLIEADVRDLATLESNIGQVDAIVHLAALISSQDSLRSPDEYSDVNIGGLLRVIDFAARNRVPRIIFASSSTIYGDHPAAALAEEMVPAPLTVYALTKLAGEHLLHLYGKLHGFSHCSLRLFNVYGPRQATDHPYANVTCKFAHAAANGLPVKLYGDGEQSRDFVYVSDVVDAICAALLGSEQAIYNVGRGEARRINDLLAILNQMSASPLAVEQCPAWPNDLESVRADTRRLEADFGFRPQISLEQGLAQTVDWFRSQPQEQG
ncbi:MAG: NAD-dependent epimerase/dehydratase family protein [Sphingomicrobium sp.]